MDGNNLVQRLYSSSSAEGPLDDTVFDDGVLDIPHANAEKTGQTQHSVLLKLFSSQQETPSLLSSLFVSEPLCSFSTRVNCSLSLLETTN